MCSHAATGTGRRVGVSLTVAGGDPRAPRQAVDRGGAGHQQACDQRDPCRAGRADACSERSHQGCAGQGQQPGDPHTCRYPPLHRGRATSRRGSDDRPGDHLGGGQGEAEVCGAEDDGRAGALRREALRALDVAIRRPSVWMIRQPPVAVPSAMARRAVVMTQSGGAECAGSRPAVISVRVITPIVFCASLVPCASATSDADATCAARNPRSSVPQSAHAASP